MTKKIEQGMLADHGRELLVCAAAPLDDIAKVRWTTHSLDSAFPSGYATNQVLDASSLVELQFQPVAAFQGDSMYIDTIPPGFERCHSSASIGAYVVNMRC